MIAFGGSLCLLTCFPVPQECCKVVTTSDDTVQVLGMGQTPASCPSEKVTCNFLSLLPVSPFYSLVFNSLDMSRSVSVTTAGQCRLAPLIQVILDCSHLYDYTVKLLFKLHSCEYASSQKDYSLRVSLKCRLLSVFSATARKGPRAPNPLGSRELQNTSFGVPREAPGLPQWCPRMALSLYFWLHHISVRTCHVF